MSELSKLIFHGEKHILTSPFGKRAVISTSAGNTSAFHSGCDYGTYGKKLPQYAAANGSVISCGTDKAFGGAKYVWVKYPGLGVKMLHYHLDKISVKAGQAVDKSTVLGLTGQTGMATGIHLHLAVKRLSGGAYIDPEKWSKEELAKKEDEKPRYSPENYRVAKATLLHVRKGPGTAFPTLAYSALTPCAKAKIKNLTGGKADGYVKNLTFTVFEVKGNWGRTPSGWVCLDYCEVIT